MACAGGLLFVGLLLAFRREKRKFSMVIRVQDEELDHRDVLDNPVGLGAGFVGRTSIVRGRVSRRPELAVTYP